MTNGTDAPVESIDPIANYHAAVTRRVPDGSTFYPGQTMSRMEALRSYTIQNAFAAFEDDIKGTLSPGKLADITVLSRDITTVADDDIRQARVAYTIIGGRVVYELAEGFRPLRIRGTASASRQRLLARSARRVPLRRRSR